MYRYINDFFKELKEKYPRWGLPTKIGLFLGLGSIVLGIASLLLTLFPNNHNGENLNKTKIWRVPLFNGRKHLGDNHYARVGGVSLPTWDNPQDQNFDGLIFYDKKEQEFLSSWGSPRIAQIIAAHYRPILSHFNLGVWNHIMALNFDIAPGYEGQTVKIDYGTTLFWKENEGNFYYRFAPFAWVKTLNLYKELMFLNADPLVKQIKSVKFVITGFHGGKRQDQPEQLELMVNKKIYKLSFDSMEVRNEEVLAVTIDPQDLIVSPNASNNFAIIVLPFQERYPVPPPNSKYQQIGPAHFRDIEVGESFLEISM